MSPVVSLKVRKGVSACFLIMQMHEAITTILLVYVLWRREMKTPQGSDIRFPVHSWLDLKLLITVRSYYGLGMLHGESKSVFLSTYSLSLSVSCRKREVNKKVLKVPEIEVKVSFEIMSLPISYLFLHVSKQWLVQKHHFRFPCFSLSTFELRMLSLIDKDLQGPRCCSLSEVFTKCIWSEVHVLLHVMQIQLIEMDKVE